MSRAKVDKDGPTWTDTTPPAKKKPATIANVSLHDLGIARDILDTWLEEHEGELLPELQTLLEDLDCDVTEKAERVALYILECEATAAACAEEAKRLNARGAARLNRAKSLRGYLQIELTRLGKKSIDGTRVSITRQNNSVVSVECADPAMVFVQEQYAPDGEGDATGAEPCVTRRENAPTYHLNRAEVERRFKNNEPLPPGIVAQRGEHVRIR